MWNDNSKEYIKLWPPSTLLDVEDRLFWLQMNQWWENRPFWFTLQSKEEYITSGHQSFAKYLVELGKDGLDSLNYENETTLFLDGRNGREYLVKYSTRAAAILTLHLLMAPRVFMLPVKMDITQQWNVYWNMEQK